MAKRRRRRRRKGPARNLRGVPRKLFRGEKGVQQWLVPENIQYFNPNTYTPFGSQEVTFDENGKPVVNQNLSQNQQQILNQGEGLTQMGQQLAQQGLQNYSPFQMGNFDEQRARIEEAAFARLTPQLEQNYQQTRQQKEQELFNKGIPYSNDPNSRFQRELGDVDRRYDEARLNARNQAAVIGGQELQRQYGIDLGTHQQGLSDISTLQQQGTGLQLPQFQQYQGQGMQFTSPAETYFAQKGIQQGNKQLALEGQRIGIAQQVANQANQPPPAPSPFLS